MLSKKVVIPLVTLFLALATAGLTRTFIAAIVLVILLNYLGMALLGAVLLVGGGLLVYAVMAGNSKWNQLD